MSKDVIGAILFLIAMLLVFIAFATESGKELAGFVYFFVRDSGEVVGNTISDLVTISGGMPGETVIKYMKPSMDYSYEVDANKKIIFVNAIPTPNRETEDKLSKIKENLNIVLQEVYSTTGVEIENDVERIASLYSIDISKNDKDGVILKPSNIIEEEP